MRIHCTTVWKSTTVLQYMVSKTTYWGADMMDMLCTIDDHRWLRHILADDTCINDECRAQATIDTKWWAQAQPSWKVDRGLDLRLFHFSCGHPDFFVSLWIAIHSYSSTLSLLTFVVFQGGYYGNHFFSSVHLFLTLRCIGRGEVLHDRSLPSE